MHQLNDFTQPNEILELIDACMHTQPEEALRLCERIFTDERLSDEPLAYVIAAERYGKIMDHLGRAAEARNTLFAAQQVAQSALLFINEAKLLEQIARSYYSSSEHRLALQYWARCIEISDLVYFGLGDYASGLDLLVEAESRIAEVNDPYLGAKIKINLGVGFSETNRLPEAETVFLQTLDICSRHQLLDYAAESNFYLGKIGLTVGALDVATAYLDAALLVAHQINYCWCEANILATQAEVHARRGEYRLAIDVVKAAQAIAISNNFLHMLIHQHFAAAGYGEALNDLQTAIVEFKSGRDCEQRVLAGTASERNRELEEKAGLRPSVSRLLVELSNNQVIQLGELEPAFQLIARESSHILAVTRTSLWLLDPQSETLVCRCLYMADRDEFSGEESLHQKDYPIYFKRLTDAQPLVAHDALHHPHIAELEQSYLKIHGIKSMLIVPIRLVGDTTGILCFEAVGTQRNWTPDDIRHGTQLSEVSARVIAGFEHKMYQEQISALNARVMRANEMLEARVMERTVSLERHTVELHELHDQLDELRKKIKEPEQEASVEQVVVSIRPRIEPPVHELNFDPSEERLRDLIHLSSDWCWEQDDQFRTTYIDGAAQEKSGLTREFMLGKRHWDFPVSNLSEADWAKHQAQLENHEPFFDLELHLLDSTQGQRWVSISGQPIFDAGGTFIGYRGIGKEITARKEKEDRIRYLATHDALTSLPNRSLFSEFLNRTIQAGKRYNRRFAVVFIDLDRFKLINDTLGHEAGDTLLTIISSRLQKCLRTSDVVARLGGDEFVVLLQEMEKQEDAGAVANKILSSVISPVTLLGQECRVTASIGICMYTGQEDEQAMMKNADIAMYRAKEDGKNNFRFYSEGIKTQSLERMIMENSLRRAVEFKQFFLHYQAKVDLKSGVITGVEALVRWQHPELGEVQPLRFIPLAEETGLIVPIGRWVLQEACMQNVAWQRMGVAPLCMAVNLSSRQFTDEALLSDIEHALQQSGMDPTLLELELTESMVIQNFELAGKLLASIKRLGVRLAIDDFGTGYSSLSQLKHFPIDTLKVDRSFIQDIPVNLQDRAITRAIIDMGKTLNLTVVAEGVENDDQMSFLRDSCCDEIQGFHFSKPIGPDQFLKLWQDNDLI
jgi:diguanylate cyclase (GGDEF)-like protein/PAS domain S-box-containing protein